MGTSGYEYVQLKKASLISSALHNFYGVVIDATFPYKTNSELIYLLFEGCRLQSL